MSEWVCVRVTYLFKRPCGLHFHSSSQTSSSAIFVEYDWSGQVRGWCLTLQDVAIICGKYLKTGQYTDTWRVYTLQRDSERKNNLQLTSTASTKDMTVPSLAYMIFWSSLISPRRGIGSHPMFSFIMNRPSLLTLQVPLSRKRDPKMMRPSSKNWKNSNLVYIDRWTCVLVDN